MLKRLARWEEDRFNDIVERAADKYPDWFWKDPPEKPRMPLRPEPILLSYWPSFLTFGYWYYLFDNLEGKGYGSDEYPNWLNVPPWGEIRYLFTDWEGKWSGFKWAWIQLTDETKGRRLICRFRGHPSGEFFYNPGGSEPDHRCKDCGESIG